MVKIHRFVVKPEPPALDDSAQLSYYRVDHIDDGFILCKGDEELLRTSTWDELLDKTGAWPMTDLAVIRVDDVKRQFDTVVSTAHDEAQELMGEVQVFGEIQSQEDLELVNEVIREAKRRKKTFEDERGKAGKPLREALEVVYSWFRMPISVYDKIEQIMKQKVLEYHRRQREERQRALDVAGAAAMQGDQITAVAHMQVAAEAEVEKVKGLSIRHVWTYEITNEAIIPREFLTPDHIKIGAYVQTHKGGATIPGVRVYQAEQVASRR